MVTTYPVGRSKTDILADLPGYAQPGSPIHEQQKMAIIVRCTEDLEVRLKELTDQISSANASNSQLSEKVYNLNRTLTWATWVGAIATAIATCVVVIQFFSKSIGG